MPGKDLTRWGLNEDGSWSRFTTDYEDLEYLDATKSAIAAAKALGVDLATVTGTGAGGRITKADVETAAEEA